MTCTGSTRKHGKGEERSDRIRQPGLVRGSESTVGCDGFLHAVGVNLFDGAVPLSVDAMDDAVSARYAGEPTRIYLIGKDGRVR